MTEEGAIQKGVLKNCPTCSKGFWVKPSHAPKSTYCSRACMATGYKSRMLGESNPKWRGGFTDGNIEVVCSFCQNVYRTFESATKRAKQNFCSTDCYHKSKIKEVKVRSKNTHPRFKVERLPKPKIIKLCPVCGKDVTGLHRTYCSNECVNSTRTSAKNRLRRCPMCFQTFKAPSSGWPNKKYCSTECHGASQSLRQLGPNSHLWQGGKTNRTMHLRNHPLYTAWRNKVFVRDNYTCQSCFRTSAELKKGKLTAHHHIRFSDDARLRFKVSNGLTLCWQCHKDYHKFVRDGSLATKESDLMVEAQKFFSSEPGVAMFKIHGEKFQERGMPDFMGLVAGRLVGIELKIFPNYATQVQQHQLKRIREAGGAAFVCRSIDEVRRVIYIVKEAAIEDEI